MHNCFPLRLVWSIAFCGQLEIDFFQLLRGDFLIHLSSGFILIEKSTLFNYAWGVFKWSFEIYAATLRTHAFRLCCLPRCIKCGVFHRIPLLWLIDFRKVRNKSYFEVISCEVCRSISTNIKYFLLGLFMNLRSTIGLMIDRSIQCLSICRFRTIYWTQYIMKHTNWYFNIKLSKFNKPKRLKSLILKTLTWFSKSNQCIIAGCFLSHTVTGQWK